MAGMINITSLDMTVSESGDDYRLPNEACTNRAKLPIKCGRDAYDLGDLPVNVVRSIIFPRLDSWHAVAGSLGMTGYNGSLSFFYGVESSQLHFARLVNLIRCKLWTIRQ
jgi:hypothetical protein